MKKVVAKVKTVREIGIFRISLVREKTVDYYGQRVVRPADAFQLIRDSLRSLRESGAWGNGCVRQR